MSNSNKIIFIADFSTKEVLGGGELCNKELMVQLKNRGYDVEFVLSSNLTLEKALENEQSYFIIGNFLLLDHGVLCYIRDNCSYVIMEHDHKYLKNRNPAAYPEFKAPEGELRFIDFYRNAKAIFCQSKLHHDIVSKNLKFDNIVNLGCNLWSDETLDKIQELSKERQENGYSAAIMKSQNPIKGQREAEAWCKRNGYDYTLISSPDYFDFLKQLSEYDMFVFSPTSPETFSRVTVEARMLGLTTVVNKKLVGAASESWFRLKGLDLIDFIRLAKDTVVKKVIEHLFKREEEVGDITVILTLYRRPQNLPMQIKAIKEQTIKPKQIWVWKNYHEDNEEVDLRTINGIDRWIDSNFNWKFYGRFALAMMADTKYIALFDDDTIPGPRWFQNCMEQPEGIQGGIGVVLHDEEQYDNHTRHGWATKNDSSIEVDLVGHAWFFEQRWLSYIWMEKPYTWHNGEDIHFSYVAQKYGNIKTFVPPQDDKEKTSSIFGYELGVDEVATSRVSNHAIFYNERDNCIKHAIANGWKTLMMRNK